MVIILSLINSKTRAKKLAGKPHEESTVVNKPITIIAGCIKAMCSYTYRQDQDRSGDIQLYLWPSTPNRYWSLDQTGKGHGFFPNPNPTLSLHFG